MRYLNSHHSVSFSHAKRLINWMCNKMKNPPQAYRRSNGNLIAAASPSPSDTCTLYRGPSCTYLISVGGVRVYARGFIKWYDNWLYLGFSSRRVDISRCANVVWISSVGIRWEAESVISHWELCADNKTIKVTRTIALARCTSITMCRIASSTSTSESLWLWRERRRSSCSSGIRRPMSASAELPLHGVRKCQGDCVTITFTGGFRIHKSALKVTRFLLELDFKWSPSRSRASSSRRIKQS